MIVFVGYWKTILKKTIYNDTWCLIYPIETNNHNNVDPPNPMMLMKESAMDLESFRKHREFWIGETNKKIEIIDLHNCERGAKPTKDGRQVSYTNLE